MPLPSLPFSWLPGQHLGVIGQTGTGKSTLAAWLLQSRRYKMVLKSKPDTVRYDTDRTVRKAAELDDSRYDSFTLNPDYERQAYEFWGALERAWKHGGWTVYGDELFYLSDRLRLEPMFERLLTQGRSKHITVAVGMQRPVRVTRFALSELTHVLSFRLEGRDAKELSHATTASVEREVVDLPEHHFVWYRRPDKLWKGYLDLKRGQLVGDTVR